MGWGGSLLGVDAADAFEQPDKLEPHRLIVDRGQRPTYPQVQGIGHQGLYLLAGLADDDAVGLEVRNALVERLGDLLEADRADPVDALLVFLDLLERDAQRLAELVLADARRNPSGADLLAERLVSRGGGTLQHLFGFSHVVS